MDEITPCLRDSQTEKLVATTYAKATADDLKAVKEAGWRFDWEEQAKFPGHIHKLTLERDSKIQGLVSHEICAEDKICELHLAESAPHNIGKNGVYKGVGPHLFAIACSTSKKADLKGEIVFVSKSKLVEHYRKTLGAKSLIPGGRRMWIDEHAANILINTYIKG